MVRKSFTPLIKTTLETYPDLKDNYEKLTEKVGCYTRTIERYFENIELIVQSDNSLGKKNVKAALTS